MNLISSLIQPVVRALALAGVTQKELLGGGIEHTELMWQVPPLRSETKLHGAPVSQLFDSHPPRVVIERLYEFWLEAMKLMRHAPYKVCDADGAFRALSYCMPNSQTGERRYWLTVPEDFPNVSEYAGVRLSLEVAHLAQLTHPVSEFVSNDDSYYVVTVEGYEMGVRDGLPIVESDQWDLPVTGMVQDLLTMSRGSMFVGCDYDLIAKLRSAVHEHREMLQDFEGVELALQGLRVLAAGKHVQEVQHALSMLDLKRKVSNHRQKVILEAIEVSNAFTISDRARVIAIRALLVPEVLTASAFKQKIFFGAKIPPSLTERSVEKIRNALQLLLEEENNR